MTKLKVLQRLEVAVIQNKRILKYLLMMVVSLLLVLNYSIGVSVSTNYDRQEADACITISERLSVKGGSGSDKVLGGSFKNVNATRGVDEVAHHMPQNAYNKSIGLSRNEGPALLMSQDDHALIIKDICW